MDMKLNKQQEDESVQGLISLFVFFSSNERYVDFPLEQLRTAADHNQCDTTGNQARKSISLLVTTGLFIFFKTKVVVKWLTLLLHIRKISGSYLSPETGNPD
jgi:hypothetical protein